MNIRKFNLDRDQYKTENQRTSRWTLEICVITSRIKIPDITAEIFFSKQQQNWKKWEKFKFY